MTGKFKLYFQIIDGESSGQSNHDITYRLRKSQDEAQCWHLAVPDSAQLAANQKWAKRWRVGGAEVGLAS